MALQVGAAGELAQLLLADRGLEAEVEVGEALSVGEAGEALQGRLSPAVGSLGGVRQQRLGELGIAPVLLRRLFGQYGQLGGQVGQAQAVGEQGAL